MTPKIDSNNHKDDEVYSDVRKQILLSAVKTSSLDALKKLIESNGLKQDDTWLDYELLLAAFERKHKTIITFLLMKNCRVSKESKIETSTPLHHAVKLGDLKILKRLLRQNSSIFRKDENLETAFDLAVKSGNKDFVDAMFMLYNFKNANVNDENLLFCFHYFCEKNNFLAIQKFVDLGCSVNSHAGLKLAAKYHGFTPLHFAVLHEDLNTIAYLLQHHASVTEKNHHNDTPLNYAFYLQPRNGLIIDLLLTAIPTDAICADLRGLSHFHIACTRNDLNKVELFLQNENLVGLQIKSDEYIYPGYTPLHFAVQYNRVNMVKILLENGADANVKTFHGETALHLACTHNNDKWYELIENAEYNHEDYENINWMPNRKDQMRIIQLLLNYKADVNAKDNKNETPLIRVSQIFENLLLNHDQSFKRQKESHLYDIVLKEIYQRILEIINILLHHGADIYSCSEDQYLVLHLIMMAKMDHSVELAKALLYKGFDLQIADENGYSFLHWAAITNYNEKLVKLFLDHNVDVNVRNECLETPLHLSLDHKDIDESIVNHLLRNGADVNAQDHVKSTPLHAALCFQNYRIIKQLLQYGADVNLEDESGYTAVESFSLILGSDGTLQESLNVLHLIKNHVQKLKCLGLMVSDKIIMHFQYMNDLIPKEVYFNCNDHDNTCLCKKELDKLRRLQVDGCTDLFTILLKNENEMAKLIEDENLVYTLASIDEINFPQYGYFLKLQLVKGIRRAILNQTMPDSLKFLTDLDKTKLCIDHISKHFNKEDIESLIKTGHIIVSPVEKEILDLFLLDELFTNIN